MCGDADGVALKRVKDKRVAVHLVPCSAQKERARKKGNEKLSRLKQGVKDYFISISRVSFRALIVVPEVGCAEIAMMQQEGRTGARV